MQVLDYHDRMAYEQMYDQYIEKKMEEQRKESIKVIGTIIRQDLAEDFSKILVAAYESGSVEAEKISDMFGFNQSNLFSIDKNFKAFKEDFEQNQLDRDHE